VNGVCVRQQEIEVLQRRVAYTMRLDFITTEIVAKSPWKAGLITVSSFEFHGMPSAAKCLQPTAFGATLKKSVQEE
jgi:hypothetical protein